MPMKYLDFGEPPRPFGEIFGRPRHVAWPVNAYRVTLPKVFDDSNRLNAFERVILRLVDATGAVNVRELAEDTCIPPDMVEGILLRLRDREFIDEHGRVIERQPDEASVANEAAPVFITALVFRELATGKIFPFLRQVDDMNPLRKLDAGKHVDYRIDIDKAHEASGLAPREVVSALRAMKKRAAAFGSRDRLPPVQQIRLAGPPEPYFLRCPIAIQKCDGEFRIADPFGNGFSLILESAFERLLEEDEMVGNFLLDWKKSVAERRPSSARRAEGNAKKDIDRVRDGQRYPELAAHLRQSGGERFLSIARIHASIEWALFYACSLRPFDLALQILRHTAPADHAALLSDAAKDIGLRVPEHGLKRVKGGKLGGFPNGGAEFDTVLAIALLQAQQDASHPLRRIAASHPDAIGQLFAIKRKRDQHGHGKGAARALNAELPDDPFMREIVHALLPDIVFHDTPDATQADHDIRADSFLEARASLQGEFRFKVFNRLGANLQNRLVHAERVWLSCKEADAVADAKRAEQADTTADKTRDYDARSFADDLYASVQSAFDTRLAGGISPDVSDSSLIDMAVTKASAAGLGDTLPACLSTVKTSAIRGTLEGRGQTLGACVIAFLLVSDDDTLSAIGNAQPSFIDNVASVIDRRRHGNEVLRLPRTDIWKLRKAAYTTIKTLIEA